MLTPKTLNHTDCSKAGQNLTKNMNYLINSGINFGCYDIKKIVFGLENISFEAST